MHACIYVYIDVYRRGEGGINPTSRGGGGTPPPKEINDDTFMLLLCRSDHYTIACNM